MILTIGTVLDPLTRPVYAGYPLSVETDIPVSSLTNGIYVIPDFLTINAIANGLYFNTGGGWVWNLPRQSWCNRQRPRHYGHQAGILPDDEPVLRTDGSA